MIKMKRLKFFVMVIVLISIDQISKALIVANSNNLPKKIINNVLAFTYCENRGIAFGLASGYTKVFSVITLVIIVGIIIALYINYNKIGKVSLTGITFLIAGGFGNFIDRAIRSYVVDFIDIGQLIDFPIFNIADIFVVVGVIFIGISCFISNRRDSIEENNS